MQRKLVRSILLITLLLALVLVVASTSPTHAAANAWITTGSLNTGRYRHTATLLPSGKVLVAGGLNYSDWLTSAEVYDPSAGTWVNTGSLSINRFSHTATMLSSGKVLVVGGPNISSAELYDPSTGTWGMTGALSNARNQHTATMLANGKVLVAGGYYYPGTPSYLTSGEVYDPGAGTWAATGDLNNARARHTATLLPNGKVLVTGGEYYDGSSHYLNSAELYDASSGAWSTTSSLLTARTGHTATLLPNGKVLVIGGYNGGGYPTSAELYDPSSGAWSTTSSLLTARARHTATLLPSGKVLVTGGYNGGGNLTSTELYDPSSGTWNTTSSLLTARSDHTATVLPNGKVLVAGGDSGTAGLASVEVYDIQSIDLSVDLVSPVQALEGQPLVRNKATAVKAIVRKTGSGTANNVSARLTYGSSTLTDFYVAESSNLDAQNVLKNNNTTYPLNFASGDTTKSIYFFSDSLMPTGSTFQASVMADYLGAIAETDETNNTTTSTSVSAYEGNWSGLLFPDLYIHYFRTDWDSTPLANFDSYYQASNDFLKGVYPVSGQRFTPNVSANYVGNTMSLSGGDGKLNQTELGLWILATLPQMRIAHPTADRYIATVPSGWFAANTTGGNMPQWVGVAYPAMRELVISEARTTSKPNGPSIAAHEIGHSYQLDLGCEEYNSCNASRQDNIGNYASPGLWVGKRIPIQSSTERKIYCFMGAYDDREYWIDADDYSILLNDHKASAPLTTRPRNATNQVILAVGTFYNNGNVTLDNWYVLPEGELSTLASGPYTSEYQDASSAVLYQQSFDVSFNLMGTSLTESPFVFTIPYLTGTAKVVVKQNDVSKAQKNFSANAPTVNVVSPNGGERLSGQTTIRWSGADADGDTLSYAILFSRDNGASWEPIGINVTGNSYTWNIAGLPAGTQYLVKVIATDGINAGQDTSNTVFTIGNFNFFPFISK